MAALSRYEGNQDNLSLFPFYEQARKAIPDEREWAAQDKEEDVEFMDAMNEFLGDLSPKELDHMLNGVQKPYVNPYAGIGRNDLCPCGSGKKFKKCCGRG